MRRRMGIECGKRSDVWEKESLCSRIRPKKEIIEGQPVATNLVPKGTRNTTQPAVSSGRYPEIWVSEDVGRYPTISVNNAPEDFGGWKYAGKVPRP